MSDLKEMYDAMVENFRGEFNPQETKDVYTCKNQHKTYTLCVSKGVAPMTMDCPVCGKPAVSERGKLSDDELRGFCNSMVFYRPKLEELHNLGLKTLQTVLNGYLLPKPVVYKQVPGDSVPCIWVDKEDGTKVLHPLFTKPNLPDLDLLETYLMNPSFKKEPNTFISNIDPHKVVMNGVNIGSLFDLVMSNDTVHGKPSIEVAREIIKENMV